MASIGRQLNLRSYEPWFALGGLVVLRQRRGVAAPARRPLPDAPVPDAAWLTATLTFGSPFDTLPPGMAERVSARELLR